MSASQLRDGIVNVLHAEEYPRPDFNGMIDITVGLLEKYDITFESQCRVFVDGANPTFIRSLSNRWTKTQIMTGSSIKTLKHNYGSAFDLPKLMFNMMVLSVNFSRVQEDVSASQAIARIQ